MCDLKGLSFFVLEFGIEQGADIRPTTSVINMNLIPTPGYDHGTVGTHRERHHGLDDFRQPAELGLASGDLDLGGRLGALLDPEFDQREFLWCERLFALGRHDGLLTAAGKLDQQALVRLARRDGRAALASLHERFVAAHVELGFLDGAAVTILALVREDRCDVLLKGNRILAVELDHADGCRGCLGVFLGIICLNDERNSKAG
jgi:hypothetical protein